MKNFREILEARWSEENYICLNLDVELKRIPNFFMSNKKDFRRISSFIEEIIERTKDLVLCYKINPSFYEIYGEESLFFLRNIIATVNLLAPEIPVILDGKVGDKEKINENFAKKAFHFLKSDGITVNPYAGFDTFGSLFCEEKKGFFIICQFGSKEFQEKEVSINKKQKEEWFSFWCLKERIPLWQYVAFSSLNENFNKNLVLCFENVPSKRIEEIRKVSNIPILIKENRNLKELVSVLRENVIVEVEDIHLSQGEDFSEKLRSELETLNFELSCLI